MKQLLNKPIEKQERHWNLNLPNQKKRFLPNNQFFKRILNDWCNKFKKIHFFFQFNRKKNKFELYTDTFDESSSEELKDELDEILSFSDITPQHLQHEIIGPRNIRATKKLRLEK